MKFRSAFLILPLFLLLSCGNSEESERIEREAEESADEAADKSLDKLNEGLTEKEDSAEIEVDETDTANGE